MICSGCEGIGFRVRGSLGEGLGRAWACRRFVVVRFGSARA